MASQKELVAVVAEHMGVPIETVTVMDRLLAEAGLRTRALRGRGNTPMSYRDGANLIIATALGAGPKDAVRLVNEYGDLQVRRLRESASRDKTFLGVTFGDALANMIESVAASRVEFSAHEDEPNHMAAEVTLFGPEPRAEIMLQKNGGPFTFEYGQPFGRIIDLKRTVRFSQITLGFVGEAIAEGFAK
ncbi:hypothetical protein [Aminobacter sp. AP02]|uniref:hypothetical protein n=1 Tax=Aminobacter sp. AP02 TaxID=2135737 RepID=UPI000D6B0422|nr:hypothetical protein [Aminobacter sp. AP02]PWK65848.1 hypothetical protein C8K44_11563 [Aminobacter sp. AP02]